MVSHLMEQRLDTSITGSIRQAVVSTLTEIMRRKREVGNSEICKKVINREEMEVTSNSLIMKFIIFSGLEVSNK